MRIVVPLSGGIDSTALLAELRQDGHQLLAVSFGYGQRHAREIDAATLVAQAFGVEQVVVPVGLDRVASSALTGCGSIPHGHYADASMKATVVPNRNAAFVCLAGALAISRGFDGVAIAAHAGDHAIYPDCRREWADAMQEAVRLGNWGAERFQLLTPYVLLSKAEIVRRGWSAGAPFSMTWSCYEGGAFHCGRCGTCVERAEAFALAGIVDPTEYADGNAA